jgi:multiple RNA-binding domain-containing protein 1
LEVEIDLSLTAGRRIMVTRYIEKDTSSETAAGKDRNKWKDQEESLRNEESIAESGRIFVRNLSYTVTEDDIEQLFNKFGELCIIIYSPLNFQYTKKKQFRS